MVAQKVKNLPAMQETWVWFLGWKDLLEKAIATHSSFLVCWISWREETVESKPMGLQRVRHDWVTNPASILLPLRKVKVMQPFQTDFLHLGFCTEDFFTSLHSLRAHFSSALDNISLSKWATRSLSTHPLKGILAASKFWQLLIKHWTPTCRCLCGCKFSAPLGKLRERDCRILW